MQKLRFMLWMLLIGLFICDAGSMSAQSYPSKPIRLVTPGIGGSADFVARLIAQGISGPLGQQVVVDNRSSGSIPGQIVSKASPDGYTLLLGGPPLWIGSLLQNVPYDVFRDFSPITLATSVPNLLVVSPSLPVGSVPELITLAKAKPGELNYASSSTGGSAHLAAELFNSMAGTHIVHIPYNGNGPALNDLMGGRVQLMFAVAAVVMPHVKSGRLKALAVTSAKPSILLPEFPTVAASVPGYEATTTYSVLAPANTPAAIIQRLNQEIVRALNRTDVKERFLNAGVEVVGSSPEILATAMKSEFSRFGKVIKDAGIRMN